MLDRVWEMMRDMASAPIPGIGSDPFEELNRRQSRAIGRAVRARAEDRMADYHAAMAEVDRIADERVALRARLFRTYA